MADEERAAMMAVIFDVTREAADAFPEISLVPADKIPSFMQGFSKGFSQKSAPGVYVHTDKEKFSVNVSVAVKEGSPLTETAVRFQAALAEALLRAFPEKTDRVNVDVWKVMRV